MKNSSILLTAHALFLLQTDVNIAAKKYAKRTVTSLSYYIMLRSPMVRHTHTYHPQWQPKKALRAQLTEK